MTNKLSSGLVQVYTGTGKGKTTAALGLAYRAIGHGFKVCFIQFMKGSSYCGELFTSQRLKPYINFYQFGRGCPYSSMIRSGFRKCNGCGECFYKDQKNMEEYKEYASMAYEFAKEVLTNEQYDIVILYEISDALRYDLLTVVLESLKEYYVEIEGWLEEKMGDVKGEFQGGAIDILTAEEVADWGDKIREIKTLSILTRRYGVW